MARLVALVDWSASLDLEAKLARAHALMTLGGSRENVLRIHRPPFAARVLSHQDQNPFAEDPDAVRLAGGFGPVADGDHEFLRACADFVRDRESRVEPPALPEGPRGRRCLLRWSPATRELLLVTEPNGQLPIYWLHSPKLTVVASEPKAIWAIAPDGLRLDPDALVELYTVGHCCAGRTLFQGIVCAEPGSIYAFGPGPPRSRSYYSSPAFSEARRAGRRRLVETLNRSLSSVLGSYREIAPEVSLTLSGGMDSRYLLAGARRTWDRVDSITFGEPAGADVSLARILARKAGVAHRWYRPDPSFIARWAPYAVWRTDGMVSCLHAEGMDAVIAHSRHATHFLNGVGGDFLMGAFLRPSHLIQRGDPDLAARAILASRRFHARALPEILKPEVLSQATASPRATLIELLGRYRCARLGNTLLNYWLRHYAPRSTALGLALEAPWVEHLGPLVDPVFVRAAAALPLELRFMGRVYRAALAELAPELMSVAWARTGVAPRWPWLLHALGRAARRAGWLPRPAPAVDYAREFRTALLPWLRETLLSRRTLADGYFLPAYLRQIVDDHAGGRADLTAEIGMALTVELWRRLFVEREIDRMDLPPLPVAQPD